jgi:hypothetical protein
MCSTLNTSDTKNCTCPFSYLCKWRRKVEAVQVNEQARLNHPTVITISTTLLMANKDTVKNLMNAKEGDHI